MNLIQRVRKTDLARNTRAIMRNVQRGQVAIIENHGQAEAAILDIVDYYLLRALARYHTSPPPLAPEAEGLSDEAVARLTDPQERYDLVLAHYLAQRISTGRAAELLGLVWVDLRARFTRLDVPLFAGSDSLEAARAEASAADQLSQLARKRK